MTDINNHPFSKLMIEMAIHVDIFSNKKLKLIPSAPDNEGNLKYGLHVNSLKYEEFANLDDKEKELIFTEVEVASEIIKDFLEFHKVYFKEDRIYHKDEFLTNKFLISKEDGEMRVIKFERMSKTESMFTIH